MGFETGGLGPGGLIAQSDFIPAVRAYWEALRRNGSVPERALIDPRGIAHALENSFLIERIGPGLARFRIAGMSLHDLTEMDVRGMPVSCLFHGEARPRLQVELERMFAAPAILSLGLTSPRGFGRPSFAARMVILPVRGNRKSVDMALGCFDLAGEMGRAPRRFQIETSGLERLVLPDLTPQETDSRAEFRPLHLPKIAPPPALAVVAENPAKRPSHLRLVHSAD